MLNLLICLRYEMLFHLRQAFQIVTPLVFFILVVCLFPLALGPDTKLIQAIAPGIIWVAALLASLLSIGHLFRHDAEEGVLDQLILSPHPFTLIVFSKILAHWMLTGLPLVLVSPLLGFLFDFNTKQIFALFFSLLLGTPIFSLLGAVGAALTTQIRHSGILLPVLILPLYIPVFIFGTSLMNAASLGVALNGYFAILAALALVSLSFAPFFAGAALRMGGQH